MKFSLHRLVPQRMNHFFKLSSRIALQSKSQYYQQGVFQPNKQTSTESGVHIHVPKKIYPFDFKPLCPYWMNLHLTIYVQCHCRKQCVGDWTDCFEANKDITSQLSVVLLTCLPHNKIVHEKVLTLYITGRKDKACSQISSLVKLLSFPLNQMIILHMTQTHVSFQ